MSDLGYQIKLLDRENARLNDLNNYRVMTTQQIRKIHFSNSVFYVDEVLKNIRKEMFNQIIHLKKRRKGKKGYAYHRLTRNGIGMLDKAWNEC